MARKSTTTTPAVPTEADMHVPEELTEGVNLQAASAAAYSEERDLLNQLLGQAQMADAFAQFSKTVFTSKLAYVKENKLYQSLNGKKNEDGLQLTGTWTEFCSLMNITPQHANEDIANLKHFGEHALDSMSRMGIGYREMRQFRRLPDDQKTALIEVAASGDKESFVELAEEIIAKHSKEKAALQERETEARNEVEARDRLLAEKNERLHGLELEINQHRQKGQAMSPDETLLALHAEAARAAQTATVELSAGFRKALGDIYDHHEAHGGDSAAAMGGYLDEVVGVINELRELFGLPQHVTDDGVPEYERWHREQEAAAAAAGGAALEA